MERQVSRTKWFDRVAAVCPVWDRLNQNELIVSFSGYKSEQYYVAQEVLGALGGLFLTSDWDKISGRTFCVVREPRGLEDGQ